MKAHLRALEAVKLLVGVDPQRDTRAGRLLLAVGAAVEEYEKSKFRIGRPAAPRSDYRRADPQRPLVVAFNGMTVEKTLRDLRSYMKQKDADETHLKELMTMAIQRRRDLLQLLQWMPDGHPDKWHVLAVANTMVDLAAGITKILWPVLE